MRPLLSPDCVPAPTEPGLTPTLVGVGVAVGRPAVHQRTHR